MCRSTRISSGLVFVLHVNLAAASAGFVTGVQGEAAETSAVSPVAASTLDVADFLPPDFVRDGTVVYHKEIQAAIDAASGVAAVLHFPAMVYGVPEEGWQLRSKLSLNLAGAVFRLSADRRQDGSVFHGEAVNDVTITGGEIAGRNDVWPDGVNIRGIHITGHSNRIRIREMYLHDLSSNGIGLFGDEETSISNVWVNDVIVENCCKRYPDYLSGEKVERGSQREDQGDIACYYVTEFVVRGCRFERSRSDGTHFYRCRAGQITDNRIYRAKMGGFFLETCENVIGRGNVVLENGSRGATIERGSVNCIFADNIVSRSGREGLWAPNCVGLVVTGNTFSRNGRKANGPEPRFIWNANITINEARVDPTNSATSKYLISGNLIETTSSQIAAIRVDATAKTQQIVIQGNLFVGDNGRVIIHGPEKSQVVMHNNHGAAITNELPEPAQK